MLQRIKNWFNQIISEQFKLIAISLIILLITIFLLGFNFKQSSNKGNSDEGRNIPAIVPISESNNLDNISFNPSSPPSIDLDNQTNSTDSENLIDSDMSLTASSLSSRSVDNNQYYQVMKVVDGDTIDVLIDDQIERLRLIGLDTPETVDPRKPVECFGLEASTKAKQLLLNKFVYLESDPSQGQRDRYGRLLRYVFLKSGFHYNLEMIKQGYAHEYTYKIPYKYQTQFKDAQRQAQLSQLGLWHPQSCQDNQISTPDNPEFSSIPYLGDCHPAYEPCLPIVGDLNCKDIETSVIVKQINIDPYKLDANKDGLGCTSN
ncbi:MAG: thermonuclease family protein [Candidatus Saccharibacteria bacterium]|nr:thermonuclease family protein [Candidatus Saccharibacteria bacterium]